MLTPEQIKNLKKGDKIVHEIRFIEECGDYIKCSFSPLFTTDKATFLIDRACVSLPSEHKTVINASDIFRNMSESEKAMVNDFLSSYFRETKKQEKMRNALKKMGVDLTNIRPKHDPNRKFKEGDRAQVVERNGRPLTCFPVGRIKVGDIVTVAENETGDVFIKVLTEDGHKMMAPWFMLELVTPVEELKRYEQGENNEGFTVVDTKACKTEAVFNETHPNAKAAAEAECARLNAEYRKGQNHV